MHPIRLRNTKNCDLRVSFFQQASSVSSLGVLKSASSGNLLVYLVPNRLCQVLDQYPLKHWLYLFQCD